LNRSVLATNTLSATKLNVRPRFEPQIVHWQRFMDFRTVEVQKFQAQKFEQFGTRIRFSQSCFNLAKYDFYTWYLYLTDKHHMQKFMKNRILVVIWEFILHFSITFQSNIEFIIFRILQEWSVRYIFGLWWKFYTELIAPELIRDNPLSFSEALKRIISILKLVLKSKFYRQNCIVYE